MSELLKTYHCDGDGMCIDPRCPRHSPPEMRALCGIRIEAPPSIALADMCKRLAVLRHAGFSGNFYVRPRDVAEKFPSISALSLEYYRIMDCVTRGEQP